MFFFYLETFVPNFIFCLLLESGQQKKTVLLESEREEEKKQKEEEKKRGGGDMSTRTKKDTKVHQKSMVER